MNQEMDNTKSPEPVETQPMEALPVEPIPSESESVDSLAAEAELIKTAAEDLAADTFGSQGDDLWSQDSVADTEQNTPDAVPLDLATTDNEGALETAAELMNTEDSDTDSADAYEADADSGDETDGSAPTANDLSDGPSDAPAAPSYSLPRPSDLSALDLVPILEAVLFAADRPVSVDRMRQVVAPKPEEDAGPDVSLFEEALSTIKARTENQDSGYELRQAHGGFHFVTRAPFSEYIRRYQASKPFRLGRAAMETLAIIGYRQPITRSEIDQVRGMDSSHLMRTLIERGLVRMAGKAEVPGRPVLYATTPRFLEVMGLNSLNDLPPLSELKQLEGDVDDPMRRMEQGLDRFMQPDPHAVPLAQQVDSQETIFDPGLSEIDALLQSAGKPQEEVFVSKVHQQVALANQEALEAFQASMPRRRKRTVTYDELVGGEGTSSETPSEEVSTITTEDADTATAAASATTEGTPTVETEADTTHAAESTEENNSGPVGNA
jgi:segregation and condensation protein B